MLISRGSLELQHYLRRDGSSALTGTWDTGGGYAVTNLVAPVDPTDAATKGYTDGLLGDYVRRDGTVPLTGPWDVDGNTITNLPTPSDPSDAATKGYADNFVRHDGTTALSGDWDVGSVKTITGLPAPVAASDAATRGFVEGLVPLLPWDLAWAPVSLQTVDATPTVVLTLDASGWAGVTLYVRANASLDDETNGCGWEVMVHVLNAVGVVSVSTPESRRTNSVAPADVWEVSVAPNGTDVEVSVTGALATTLNWVVSAYAVGEV